ncbi:transcriptional regulator, MarR family [Quadrisphaera granulorum]|uniref:MarR family transcriptional regulator n=1 Tax=Quadrisphaera granulorum TaxID=317664 RepID=A0A316A9J5_9ACTN|nr:MarR family transcriptional regulator [Quadrisphaera granulorum]PWJ54361.1 MarR family transcriptional regulator [Quadrisphaera granulorum]SZE96133.1 transcriptional regulator, MarR family [Quadrisphaera granulorum]
MADEAAGAVPAELGSRFSSAALAHDVEFLAVKAFAAGTRRLNHRLRPLELRARSYAVLSTACEPQPLTQRELATLLELDPSQVVALVDELVARGLVVRVTDERDRRRRLVQASPEGRAVHARASELAAAAEDSSLATLSPDEREALRALLRKLVFGPDPAP